MVTSGIIYRLTTIDHGQDGQGRHVKNKWFQLTASEPMSDGLYDIVQTVLCSNRY